MFFNAESNLLLKRKGMKRESPGTQTAPSLAIDLAPLQTFPDKVALEKADAKFAREKGRAPISMVPPLPCGEPPDIFLTCVLSLCWVRDEAECVEFKTQAISF